MVENVNDALLVGKNGPRKHEENLVGSDECKFVKLLAIIAELYRYKGGDQQVRYIHGAV